MPHSPPNESVVQPTHLYTFHHNERRRNGDRLKEIFLQSGLTELERVGGFSSAEWSRWLNGGRRINESTLQRIADCINGQRILTKTGEPLAPVSIGEVLDAIQLKRSQKNGGSNNLINRSIN